MDDDVVKLLIPYLAHELKGIPVKTEVPETRPEVLVTVNPSGGTKTLFVQQPRVVVDAWAQSDYEASKLIDRVTDALLRAYEHIHIIVRVEIDSIYRSDVDNSHRWSATVNILANRLN